MTEAEWLSSEDPRWMLEYLTQFPTGDPSGGRRLHPYWPSDRKLQNLCDAWRSDVCGEWRHCMAYIGVSPDDKLAPAFSLAINILSEFKPIAAHLLRDIVGNPHRPVELFWQDGKLWSRWRENRSGGSLVTVAEPVAWLTPAVLALAHGIYEERRFEDMPILADALEEAGCDHEGVLRHCRGQERCRHCLPDPQAANNVPGHIFVGFGHGWQPCAFCEATGWIPLRGHVRGCWLLDLLLGQE